MRDIDIVDVKVCIKEGKFQLIKNDRWILLEDCETGERVCIGEDVTIRRAYWEHNPKYVCSNKQNELLICSVCKRLFVREPGMLKPMKCEGCGSVMENGEG